MTFISQHGRAIGQLGVVAATCVLTACLAPPAEGMGANDLMNESWSSTQQASTSPGLPDCDTIEVAPDDGTFELTQVSSTTAVVALDGVPICTIEVDWDAIPDNGESWEEPEEDGEPTQNGENICWCISGWQARCADAGITGILWKRYFWGECCDNGWCYVYYDNWQLSGICVP